MNADEHRYNTNVRKSPAVRSTAMSREDNLHADVTEKILKAAFDVSNTLGCGFLEKVYENALVVRMKELGLKVSQQVPVRIVYRGVTVGEYIADLIVDGKVLVEVKATQEDSPRDVAQTLNYMKATRITVGLILNFGKPKLSYRRLVLRPESPDEGV